MNPRSRLRACQGLRTGLAGGVFPVWPAPPWQGGQCWRSWSLDKGRGGPGPPFLLPGAGDADGRGVTFVKRPLFQRKQPRLSAVSRVAPRPGVWLCSRGGSPGPGLWGPRDCTLLGRHLPPHLAVTPEDTGSGFAPSGPGRGWRCRWPARGWQCRRAPGPCGPGVLQSEAGTLRSGRWPVKAQPGSRPRRGTRGAGSGFHGKQS